MEMLNFKLNPKEGIKSKKKKGEADQNRMQD